MDIAARRFLTHHVASPGFERPGEVAAFLGAVQAQDFLGSLWAVGLRMRSATEAAVERAIAERSIVRTWPLRGTLHLVAAADVRWMLALLAPRVIAGAARRHRELELDEAVVARSRELFTRALRGGGRRTREELYALLEADGISTAGQRGYHLLWRTAQEGLVCLGPRQGKQQTFTLLDEWVPATPPLARDEALAELAARYFTGHGPATLPDFVWWSGLLVADARVAVQGAGSRLAREVVDGQAYWFSPDAATDPPVVQGERRACLLPAFDEYLVGYRDRGGVLDPGAAKRVNAGGGMLDPTVVVDGRVVGVWKRTLKRDRVVVKVQPFAPLNAAQAGAVAAAADEYGRFLGLPVELPPD